MYLLQNGRLTTSCGSPVQALWPFRSPRYIVCIPYTWYIEKTVLFDRMVAEAFLQDGVRQGGGGGGGGGASLNPKQSFCILLSWLVVSSADSFLAAKMRIKPQPSGPTSRLDSLGFVSHSYPVKYYFESRFWSDKAWISGCFNLKMQSSLLPRWEIYKLSYYTKFEEGGKANASFSCQLLK